MQMDCCLRFLYYNKCRGAKDNRPDRLKTICKDQDKKFVLDKLKTSNYNNRCSEGAISHLGRQVKNYEQRIKGN